MTCALLALVRALRGAGAIIDTSLFESIGGYWITKYGTGTTDAHQELP
jgi:hypothetical protein